MENNEDSTPLEVLAPSAIMAMEKAQIDMQIATAHQYPRSLEQFKKRALAMATLDPETAESCVYVRPVGKEFNDKTKKWEQKFAEGPSIRLAEIVAVSYGNIRAASKVVEQTERYVKCTGMAHDLESNAAMSADVIESTVTREGKPYSERQRALIAKVCGAKAIRDAIFKIVPRALCKPIMIASKKVAAGLDRPLEERRKKAQAWIGSLKIKEDRVLAVLGVKEWSEVLDDHLIILTGLKTAMADGDETIDSAFPAIQAPEGNKPVATAHQQATGAAGGKPGETTGKSEGKTETKQEKKPDTAKTAEGPGLGDDNLSFDNAQKPQEGSTTAQKAPEATQTGSTAQTPQEGAVAADGAGKTAVETPPEAAFEPDPALGPAKTDTDELASVKVVALAGKITLDQLMGYLRKKKLAREDQKLSELSSKKLLDISKALSQWVPEIKGQKQ